MRPLHVLSCICALVCVQAKTAVAKRRPRFVVYTRTFNDLPYVQYGARRERGSLRAARAAAAAGPAVSRGRRDLHTRSCLARLRAILGARPCRRRYFVDWYLALEFDRIVMLDMSEHAGARLTAPPGRLTVVRARNTKNGAIYGHRMRALGLKGAEWVFVVVRHLMRARRSLQAVRSPAARARDRPDAERSPPAAARRARARGRRTPTSSS
jgi:hypothetical protein